MSITPYCSKDEWAIKKQYADFDAYFAAHSSGITEAALVDMLEEATQLMNMEMGIESTTNISNAKYTTFLRNLCYRMSLLMWDEELGRAHERERSQYMPRDYMFERDRAKLHYIGLKNGTLKVGQVG